MESQDTITHQHHRCIELNLAGQPCGLRAVAGRDRCYIHGLYHALNDGRSTIDIPLLEDPNSILYVYSQVARALAQGVMPAANANGIIRCCNGALKLITEMRRHERFEERKRNAEARGQELESADAVASPLSKDQHHQMDAAVPPNLDISEPANQPATDSAVVAADPDARSDNSDASDPANTMQAAAANESGATSPDPHPGTVEAARKIIPASACKRHPRLSS